MNRLDELRRRYHESDGWGLLSSIDLHGCNGDIIRDAEEIKRYAKELCENIGMKRYGESIVVNFGNDPMVAGFSMVQLIETSLLSGHFVEQSNNAYIDIFSCKFYNPWKAAEFTKSFFRARDYKLHIAIRA